MRTCRVRRLNQALRIRATVQRAVLRRALRVGILLQILQLFLHLVIVVSRLFHAHVRRLDQMIRAIDGHNALEWNALAILRWYDYLVCLHPKSVRLHGLTVG